jgi:hypothetical protein
MMMEPVFNYDKVHLSLRFARETLELSPDEPDPKRFLRAADHMVDCILEDKEPKTSGRGRFARYAGEVRDAALVSEWNVIGYSARIYKQWFCPAYAEAAATGSAIDSLCPARLLLVCRSFDPAFYSWFFTGMLQCHYRPNPPRADGGEGAALQPSGAAR